VYKFFQLIPPFKGKLRLAKALYGKYSTGKTFSVPCGLTFVVPNLIENVSFELFVNGLYEESSLKLIIENLPPNGIFVDVGANIGAISVVLAKLRPDITIYAFEASPSVFKYLEINKNLNNLRNLYIYNYAIHNIDDLELPFYSPSDLNGKGSFSPVFTEIAEIVKTMSLDTFFNSNKINPNFIKVDVEGYECLILKSMEKFLVRNKKCKILFEFVDWAEKASGFKCGESQEFLLYHDYQLQLLEDNYSENKQISYPIIKGFAMILASKKL
jgi:FkbM family methyltransferase